MKWSEQRSWNSDLDLPRRAWSGTFIPLLMGTLHLSVRSKHPKPTCQKRHFYMSGWWPALLQLQPGDFRVNGTIPQKNKKPLTQYAYTALLPLWFTRQCCSQFVCHCGNMRFCFQPREPSTDTASRKSLCFLTWKALQKQFPWKKWLMGRPRHPIYRKCVMIGQESRCWDHYADHTQWRRSEWSRTDGGSHPRNTRARHLLLEGICNAYAREMSCHTANQSGARPITLNFWWLQLGSPGRHIKLGSQDMLSYQRPLQAELTRQSATARLQFLSSSSSLPCFQLTTLSTMQQEQLSFSPSKKGFDAWITDC